MFHLPLRQTEGLIGSILQLLGLDLPAPDFSTLSRRAQNLELPAQSRPPGGPIHLLVNSSGLKLGGPGEWLVEKHSTSKRRSWRKLHIGFDAVTGRIVASILTDRDVNDASQIDPLLDQIADLVDLFMGDGGYDRTNVYNALNERHPAAMVVVPPRADAVLSATADTDPTQRDRHIQAIAEKGRMAWQRDSGYNERARVEGQFGRWKQLIGDGLRFHSDEARVTEVVIAAGSSTECSTLDTRAPSAPPDQQRRMGPPLPLPPPCNTLPTLGKFPCRTLAIWGMKRRRVLLDARDASSGQHL